MADALVEDQLHRYPRIGAGQHGGEGLLLLGCLGLEDRQVLIEGLELAGDVALVAVHQCLERGIGRQCALGRCRRSARDRGPASTVTVPARALRKTATRQIGSSFHGPPAASSSYRSRTPFQRFWYIGLQVPFRIPCVWRRVHRTAFILTRDQLL